MKRIEWEMGKIKEAIKQAQKAVRKYVPFMSTFLISSALVVILFAYMSAALQEVTTFFQQSQVIVHPEPPTANELTGKPSRPVSDVIIANSYAFARQATFKVIPAYGERMFQNSGGTGFLLQVPNTGQIVIVTNKHVCNGVDQEMKNKAILVQGRKAYYTTIISRSRLTDICILAAPAQLLDHKPYQVAARPSDSYIENKELFVWGYPRLMPLAMAEAIYLNHTQEYFGDDLPSTRGFGRIIAEIHPGNSGSPLVNENNEVVGVIFAYENMPNLPTAGLFIPIDHALDTINGQE